MALPSKTLSFAILVVLAATSALTSTVPTAFTSNPTNTASANSNSVGTSTSIRTGPVSVTSTGVTSEQSTFPTFKVSSNITGTTLSNTATAWSTSAGTSTTTSGSTTAANTSFKQSTVPATFKATPNITAATTTSTLHCPPHVQQSKYLNDFGTHCYEFILYRKKNWPDAEIDCKHAGGLLVSIESEAEQNFIYQTLMNLRVIGDKGVWIGLSDQNQEGHWYWSAGGHVTYTNWAPGEPGISLFGSYRDCAMMEMFYNGGWVDYSCTGILLSTEEHFYICEFEKIQ